MAIGMLAARDQPTANLADTDSLPIMQDRRHGGEWSEEQYRRFRVPLGRAYVEIETSRNNLPDWLISILRELNRIAVLPSNWDSYGAVPIGQRTLEHALDVIRKIMDEKRVLPTPQTGATASGGVGFEWHFGGKDLEIEIEAPFKVHAYFYNERTGEEREDDIGTDLKLLDPILDRMTD